jgi:hypothetical protein
MGSITPASLSARRALIGVWTRTADVQPADANYLTAEDGAERVGHRRRKSGVSSSSSRYSHANIPVIVGAYDYSRFRRSADIGGGHDTCYAQY